MRVIVTLDYFDGTESKASRPVDIEEAARSFAMVFLDRNVCGVTITRADPITHLIKQETPSET